MAGKKRTSSKTRASSTKVRGRRTSSRVRRDTASRGLGRVALPLIISGILIACIAVFGFSLYQNAINSDFFDVRSIDVRGNERTTAEDIRRVVTAEVEKPGAWNADLADIRVKVEKFPFVKAASVTRILPAGIRVDVTERIPAAIVRLSAGNYLVDIEGVVLAMATPADQNFPFFLEGWDESKTEKAGPDNIARIKLYRKMLEEWKQFDLVSRVKEVNLTNPREPVAVIEDSGRQIMVTLARDDLGKSLRAAIEAVSGKGLRVRSVDSGGVSPVITYLEF